MVTGKLGAVTEKSALDTVALLTVTAADPEFVAVTVSVFVAPTMTLPKSMLAFARDSVPICGWVSFGGLPALSPWQPAKKDKPKKSINICAVFQDFPALSWVGRTAWQFGVIGDMSHPLYSQRFIHFFSLRGRTISSVDLCSSIG